MKRGGILGTTKTNDALWTLELRGALLSPLMARNALKSNVTWTSYPFIPPTATSGFFADLLGGMKWFEANSNQVRHLHALPSFPHVFALGAYPTYGNFSRRHFRAHLGSLSFNYEARVWAAGRNEGKKLAVIEEFLADELRFVLAAPEPDPLCQLHRAVRGRVGPIAKKCGVELEFTAEPSLVRMERKSATGKESTLALMPFVEIGNLPEGLIPYLVALRSEGGKNGVRWFTQYCAWDSNLTFLEGTAVFKSDLGGISVSLLKEVGYFGSH